MPESKNYEDKNIAGLNFCPVQYFLAPLPAFNIQKKEVWKHLFPKLTA
jgi:hypothetical protein